MEDEYRRDQSGDAYFWIGCPGCAFAGKIGLPLDYPADVVVCPNCRQVVRVRGEDHVLWRPADCRRPTETAVGAPPTSADRDERPNEHRDQWVEAAPRRAAGTARHTRRSPRPSSTRSRVSEALDNEMVQFALILAAGIVPLMLAIFVPRATYRVDPPDGPRVAVINGASPERSHAAERLPPAPSSGGRSGEAAPARLRPVMGKRCPVVVKPAAAAQASGPGADVLYRRGQRRRAKGDYLGAISDFDAVLRVKPEFVWCYYERAAAYSRMGNQRAALADLDRALLALPREPKVWHARAVVHHRLLNLKAAVAEICHAVELVELDERGGKQAFARLLKRKADMLTDELFAHATALVKSGQPAAAAEEFSEVIQRRPNAASAWLRRGLAYDLSGQYAKALNDLNVALELRPGPAQAFRLRSVLLERNEDYARALADMRAARRLDPARGQYAERIGWLLTQQQARMIDR